MDLSLLSSGEATKAARSLNGTCVARVELLQSAADRRNALGVEAQPVHASDVAGVLDLETAVHDDREAPGFRDLRPLFIDHRVLTPQILGTRRDRLSGNRR